MEDTEIRSLVTQLREEGSSLNEILDVLHKEHDVRMTFLELRMLVAEIEKSKPVEPAERKRRAKEDDEEETAGSSLGTQVEVDQIVQPGMQLSGSAKMRSGAKIKWFVDAYSRLSAAVDQGSAQPTQQDMVEFQQALAQKLQGGA